MLGVKSGHTIFCDETCNVLHHEVLLKLLECKRNDPMSLDNFKECVRNMVARGWDRNSEIPDTVEYFRFPLVHWAAVYGKLAVLKWLVEDGFDVEVTNSAGETALHRLIACQAHERAVDARDGRTNSRRFSLTTITQVFAKVLVILTDAHPQMILRYEYTERNTPFQLCLKLLKVSFYQRQRLTVYYESVFKTLCERLTDLMKLEKFSEEFVRTGLSHKDNGGSTLWHLAAGVKNMKALTALGNLMKGVQGLNLYIQNTKGETASMVALKNSYPLMASLIEDYKSSLPLIPVVKMEMYADVDQCCCEQRPDAHDDNGEPSVTLQHTLDKSDSSFVESSPVVNTLKLQLTEQSFTEPLKKSSEVEQQKVVLTTAKKTSSSDGAVEREMITEIDNCSPVFELTMQEDGQTCVSKNGSEVGDSFGQEKIVVERQIDLCVSVDESHDDLSLCENQKEMDVDQDLEPLQTTGTPNAPIPEGSVLSCQSHNTDCCSNHTCSEILASENLACNIELPSPPLSENNGCLCEGNVIPEACTPMSVENVCKGINVTPVLLIKLLSEPDVSERFQSLLEEVITGDTEKVDLTQSTLQQLKSSRLRLGNEITASESSLQDITAKKQGLIESIKKLQEELETLQQSEETTRSNVEQLKQEKDVISGKIGECESTWNHLKRRLSDCAGALNGLSPKLQKRC